MNFSKKYIQRNQYKKPLLQLEDQKIDAEKSFYIEMKKSYWVVHYLLSINAFPVFEIRLSPFLCSQQVSRTKNSFVIARMRQTNLVVITEQGRWIEGRRNSHHRKGRKKQDVNKDDETRKTEIKESLYHGERLGFENGNVEGVVKRGSRWKEEGVR